MRGIAFSIYRLIVLTLISLNKHGLGLSKSVKSGDLIVLIPCSFILYGYVTVLKFCDYITQVESLLSLVNDGIKNQIPTYVHCWGGHGRTGTFACCYLMQEGLSANEALTRLLQWRERLPRNHFPLEDEQRQFVEQAHAWLS